VDRSVNDEAVGSQASFLAAVSQAREHVRASLHAPEGPAPALAHAVAGVVDAAATVLVPAHGGLMRVAASPDTFAPVGEVVDVESTVCGEAYTSGRAVRVDDVAAVPHPVALDPAGCCPGAKALLSVPIVDGARVVGVVAAAADTPGWFDAMDERGLALIGQVAAARLAGLRPPAPSDALRSGPVAPVDRAPAGRLLGHGLQALGDGPGTPGLGVFTWRPGAPELTWSRELYRILGLQPDRFRPELAVCIGLVHPDDRAAAGRLSDAVHAAVADGREIGSTETVRVVGADGAVRHLQVWAVTTPDPVSRMAVHGAVVDVTRQARDRQLLERLSATDPVTGLGNRLAFDRRMHELLAAPGSPLVSLLLLDLDRFKLVNDSLGHQIGDRLLGEVAQRLRTVVPEGSVCARMGGDEFVVVPPPGYDRLHVRRLAQSLVDTLRAPFKLQESREALVCPASLGLTSTEGRDVTADQLLSEADLALYRAKDAGRDRYVVYDDALRARARSRHNAEMLLRSALEQDRLTLQYQPIVGFESGRVVGVEALVRALDPAGQRLLPPESFIDIAEDTGLVVDLDLWVIGTAVAQVAHWLRNAPSPEVVPWVAVNVSARSMEHPRVVRRLLDGMAEHRIAPHHVKVELTERSFLGTPAEGESTLRQLLSAGVPVGIDDFGTGYSAMAYLNRFDLDFMKIDRSFVAKVGQERRADAVVTAIVDLAHAHGMQVTAEGVETQRQARRLREIGCDFAQGYHFGRPMDPHRLLPV
jgi:diguanylate cyclase (GGDEF)-like protein